VARDVLSADWSPDGTQLAVVREQSGKTQIEYPIGKVLYETIGAANCLHVSPDGKHLAFLDQPDRGDARGFVSALDLAGKKTVLTSQWGYELNLAWSPNGTEIWFSAAQSGSTALWAVTLSGTVRPLERALGNLVLLDASRSGHALVTLEVVRAELSALAPGGTTERDLSWFDYSYLGDISNDGKTILLSEEGSGGGPFSATYIRKTDGSSAVRLGEGYPLSLSPDERWALALIPKDPPQLQLLPTGAGEPRLISLGGITPHYVGSGWLPDGSAVVIAGTERGHARRLYLLNPDSGQARPITPEGYFSYIAALSPDGRRVATLSSEGFLAICPLAGGKPETIAGLEVHTSPAGWSTDGKFLYVVSGQQFPVTILRLNLETHRQEIWKTIAPTDLAGTWVVPNFRVAPDGKAYAYTYGRELDDLYLVSGLK
jgi:Tol biopolymer transport system component